jgi:hypothetical protein
MIKDLLFIIFIIPTKSISISDTTKDCISFGCCNLLKNTSFKRLVGLNWPKYNIRVFFDNKKILSTPTKKERKKKKEGEGRRKKTTSCTLSLFSLFDNSGMFHSDDERNRNVDPYNESRQSYGTTTTTTDKRNSTCTFELGQFTPCDFDTFGFDFDSHFGGGRDSDMSSQWTDNNSSTFFVSTTQCSTTFSPEDKWPI